MTTFDSHANFAQSTIAVAPSPAVSGTMLTVLATTGAQFPATPFNATIWPNGTIPSDSTAEIVRVTNITGDVFTITRAQEGTTAQTVTAGYAIAATATAKTLTDIETAVNAAAPSTSPTFSGEVIIAGSSTTGLLQITNSSNTSGNAGDISIFEAAASNVAIGTAVSGDADARFIVQADGTHKWGPGNAGTDVTFGRTSAGVLSITGDLAISGPIYANSGTDSAGSAPVITSIGAVSGTAKQLSDTSRDYMVYLEVTTSGTATSLTLGHTSAASDVTILSSVSVTAGNLYSFRLPAGWYFKWTGTTTAMGNQNAVGC